MLIIIEDPAKHAQVEFMKKPQLQVEVMAHHRRPKHRCLEYPVFTAMLELMGYGA